MRDIKKMRKFNTMGVYNHIKNNRSSYEKLYYEKGRGKVFDSFDEFIEEILSDLSQ